MVPKILVLTNIPSPYRVLQLNKLAKILNGNLCVIYFQETEPNRNWNISKLEHRSVFLKRSILSRINFHPDILKHIVKENPNIIIVSGFTLTVLITFIYTQITKKKFMVFTDSWLHPVNNMKFYHRLVRRFIIPRADASICVGIKGKEFLVTYGAKENSIFTSPLAIDNDYYRSYYQPIKSKEFDLIFSGQFIDRKMPFFVLDVLKELKSIKNNISILIIGSGPLEREIIRQLDDSKIIYFFPGFIQQEDLPKYYANSKILVFPTKEDPWGIVANEACAVGTPVITCEYAGAADDLVIHNFNGFVLPLSVDVWVKETSKLLSDSKLYESFSENSLKNIQKFSIENAANGLIDAINFCKDINKQ